MIDKLQLTADRIILKNAVQNSTEEWKYLGARNTFAQVMKEDDVGDAWLNDYVKKFII